MTALGFALLLVGAALLIAEAHVPGGVLGVSGALALMAGLVILIPALGGATALAVPVGLGFGLAAGGFALLVARKGVRAQRGRVRAGAEALSGHLGVVRSWSARAGQVFVDGALWRAQENWGSEDGPLHEGDVVVVEGVHGLTLSVRRADEWELIA
ncbi:MAG: NfeD family protein [Solirubrobacteraceae bacterium]